MLFTIRSKRCCHSFIGFCQGFPSAKNIIEWFISNFSSHCNCHRVPCLSPTKKMSEMKRSILCFSVNISFSCTRHNFYSKNWLFPLEWNTKWIFISLCVDFASPCTGFDARHIGPFRIVFLRYHVDGLRGCCIRWTSFGWRRLRGVGHRSTFRASRIIVSVLTGVGRHVASRISSRTPSEKWNTKMIFQWILEHWTLEHWTNSRNHWNKPRIILRNFLPVPVCFRMQAKTPMLSLWRLSLKWNRSDASYGLNTPILLIQPGFVD